MKIITISRENLSKSNYSNVMVAPGQSGSDHDIDVLLEYLHYLFSQKGYFDECTDKRNE